VKTAISVPDELFQAVDLKAKELGMSRSALFSKAASAYLSELERDSLARRIDHALASFDTPDDDEAFRRAAARRALGRVEW
jgi:metal-responsive CopG/Arc/MetJ family transcriptional regulator